MKSPDDLILRFMGFLATMRSMFRTEHLFAEKHSALRDVSTMVIPFQSESIGGDYAEEGVTLQIALNAELVSPLDDDRKALGMSLLIRRCTNEWIFEAEIGWTGREVGWDPLDAREVRNASIERVFELAPSIVEWLGGEFRKVVGELEEVTDET